MSNTIAHIKVAKEILNITGMKLDAAAYFFGTVAPDTIGSKPDFVRADKKRVHLREDISDIDWLLPEYMAVFDKRIEAFVQEHILAEPDEKQKSFNIGYLVHLLVDKWNHKTVRQKMLQKAETIGVKEGDKAFYYMMLNDLGALDQYILDNDSGTAGIFRMICDAPVTYSLHGYIEPEYIEKSIAWWTGKYIPEINELKLQHLEEQDIEEFIEVSSTEIAKGIKELF